MVGEANDSRSLTTFTERTSPSTIRVIIFDLGGVLVRWNDEYLYRAAAGSLHLDVPAAKTLIRPVMVLLMHGELKASTAESKLGLKSGFFKDVFVKHARANKSVLHLSLQLRNRGYSVVILSNTIEPHAAHCRRQGWFDGFDALFLSYKLGCSKPSKRIFKIVTKRLRVPPKSVVFIDDSNQNLTAAARIGMRTVKYGKSKESRRQLVRLARKSSVITDL